MESVRLYQHAFSRREALATVGTGLASALLFARSGAAVAFQGNPANAEARALLDNFADNYLRLSPESATSLGIDTGTRAGLRHKLGDRSQAGRDWFATVVRSDLTRARAFDASKLDFQTRTNFEVVRSAYETSSEGFAMPYGDVAVGGWRNSPYVVIQNVGAYLDTPQFLENDHPIETKDDAQAYLDRLAQYPLQLDGELGRMRSARAQGLVPPGFLIDAAIPQLGIALKDAASGGRLVSSLVDRAKKKGIAGDWEARARAIVERQVAPALDRQIAELKAERAVATDVAGMWSRPHGDDYYRWALKAGTTTTLPPQEIHRWASTG